MKKLKILTMLMVLLITSMAYGQRSIVQDALLTVTVVSANPPTTCGGADGNISVTATPTPTTYLWSNGSTGANLSGLSANTYIVTATSTATICTATQTIPLGSITPPNVTTQPQLNQILCSGQALTVFITADNTLTYQWYKDDVLIPGATSATYTLPVTTISDAGSYKCKAMSGACFQWSNTGYVTVKQSPVVNIPDATVNFPVTMTTLVANNGVSYLWSNGSTNPSITVQPTITTTYAVTVTSANGCSTVDSVTVYVNGGPLAINSISANPANICIGASTQLNIVVSNGVAPYTYVWSNGSTSANQMVSPMITTTYTVTVTDANGTTQTGTVTVNVNTPPTANAGLDHAIALGSSTNIGTPAIGGCTYAWSSYPSGFTSTSANPITIPTSSTVYTVTVTNAGGCTSSDDVIVSTTGGTLVASSIVSTIGQTITLGQTTQIMCLASGGTAPYTYSWSSAPAGFSASMYNPTVAPTVTTTYTVLVTDANGLTATASMTINVLIPNPPTATVGFNVQNQTICFGDSATFAITLSGVSPWSVRYNAGMGNVTINNITSSPYTVTVSPTTTTTYLMVEVTDSLNQTASATGGVTITVNPLPVVAIAGTTTICPNTSTTLTASGGTGYHWSSGSNVASAIVAPTATTTYHVTVTSNGCSSTDSVQVIVYPTPTANAGVDQNICSGSSTNLSANIGSSYSWASSPAGFTSVLQSPSVSPTVTTVYMVTVTDSNGCSATDNMIVNVTQLPVLTMTASASTVCAGTQVTITCNPSIPGGTYSWSTLATTQSINVTPNANSSYSVNYSIGACVNIMGSQMITVNQLPTVSLGADQIVCSGSPTLLQEGSGNAYSNYLWSNTTTQPTLTVNPTATSQTTIIYWLQVQDSHNCVNRDTINLTVNPLPLIDAGPTTSICQGQSATLAASGGTGYSWSSNPTGFASTLQSPMVSPTVTTIYTVTGSGNGCFASDNVTVYVNANPTANAGQDINICTGSVILSATGGASYAWDNGVSQGIPFTPISTTLYTVTVTGTNACTSTDQVTVFIHTMPTVDAGVDKSICAGSSVSIGVSTTGGNFISWDNTASLSSPNTIITTATPTTTTVYNVTVNNTLATGCLLTDQIVVTVNANPVITASSVPVCANTDIQLIASSNVNACTFQWAPATGLTGANTATPTFNYGSSQTYSVLATSPSGCVGVKTVDVTVTTAPLASFSAEVKVAWDDGSVEFTNNSSSATSYLWDYGDGTTSTDDNPTHIHAYIANGNYNVNLTASNQCGSNTTSHIVTNVHIGIEEVLAALNINIFPNPVIDIVHFTGTENIESFNVVNMSGQIIHEQKIPLYENSVDYDMSLLGEGIYIINFTMKNGSIVPVKVVK